MITKKGTIGDRYLKKGAGDTKERNNRLNNMKNNGSVTLFQKEASCHG
jgi:hypothetical protein